MWTFFYLTVTFCVSIGTQGMYAPSDDVIDLTAVNFDPKVLQGDELWLVEFYAPWCGHCQSLAPEWKKAASALKGIVKVGAVDMDQHQSVGAPYGIQGFPTIKIFGLDKKKPEDYNGGRDAKSFVDAAMSKLKSMVQARMSGRGGSSGGGRSGGSSGGSGSDKDVIELTDTNFEELVIKSEDMWLVEFFAPWCGHCKTLAPHWATAATDLKGKVKLGAMDATIHRGIAGKYGVQGFPTIKMFAAGKDREPVDYDGGRTGSEIVTWALDKLAENIPAPEAHQITDENTLKNNCEGHQLCILSILPHILDCQSDCRNRYINIMKEMGVKYKKQMWGWIWAEAMQQPDLEESLGIGGFGYPAMAAINTRKMKYALLKGSFSDKGINEFLRELSFGRGSTAPVKNAKLPSVKKTDPWDGKDGKLEVEEDIDLSDVDLDDLDTDKKDEL